MIKLNDVVKCQPNGNLTCPFEGIVEHIYERTVMVTVTAHHPNDHWKLMELMGRVIVALDKVEPHQLQLEPARVQNYSS